MQSTIQPKKAHFRLTFFFGDGGETLRAYLLFGILLVVLVAISVQLVFREASIAVLTDRLDLGRAEARRIAHEVEQIGGGGSGIDFSRVREAQALLRSFIAERISDRLFISHVEIRDRFGIQQVLVVRPGSTHPLAREPLAGTIPVDWPSGRQQTVTVPLRAAEGAVVLGVSTGPLIEELADLQDELRLKVIVAGAVAVIVLVAGFFYVLYLLRKNRRLEQARQSARRASYVGLLASGLAHEIRNPLNAMSVNLQMLKEELEEQPDMYQGECRELLTATRSEIDRLEQVVKNFLAYARPAQPRFATCDLNAVVADVLRFLEADFRQSNVDVQTDYAQLLPTTEIDETLFKQALINLLVNARQVMQGGGRVKVTTRAGSAGDVVLEIADNGPGIPREMRDRIFEVFFSTRGGGTGLGLPIARQIIERHGGTISMKTVEGEGTTFSIHLPRRHLSRSRAALMEQAVEQ